MPAKSKPKILSCTKQPPSPNQDGRNSPEEHLARGALEKNHHRTADHPTASFAAPLRVRTHPKARSLALALALLALVVCGIRVLVHRLKGPVLRTDRPRGLGEARCTKNGRAASDLMLGRCSKRILEVATPELSPIVLELDSSSTIIYQQHRGLVIST